MRAPTEQQALSRLWRNRARSMNMRARMYQADGLLAAGDLREIVKRDGSRCIYCDRDLDYEKRGENGSGEASFDHIIRLIDGGSHTYANVACACRTCNQRNNRIACADPTAAGLQRLQVYLGRKP